MARGGQRQSGARRTGSRNQRRPRALDNEGIIPVLARAVREVETAVQRGRVMPSSRTKFQVVALLVREERARRQGRRHDQRGASAASSSSASTASPRSSPRPPPATPRCWRCSPRTPCVSDAGRAPEARDAARRRPRGARPRRSGPASPPAGSASAERRVVPQSVISAPAGQPLPRARLLRGRAAQAQRPPAGQLGAARPAVPLLRVRRRRSSCMDAARAAAVAAGARRLELMPHQAQVVAAAADGPPHLPARRRARPRQDRAGAARRAGRQRLPAARRRPQRRQDQLGPRGRASGRRSRPVDRDPRRRRRRSTASPTS